MSSTSLEKATALGKTGQRKACAHECRVKTLGPGSSFIPSSFKAKHINDGEANRPKIEDP